MKRVLFLLLGLGLAGTGHSQVFVNGQAIPDSCRYLTVAMASRGGGYEGRADVCSQPVSTRNRLTDAAGTPRRFRSFLELVETLDRQGWEYLDSTVRILAGNSAGSQYLFRRKRPAEGRH